MPVTCSLHEHEATLSERALRYAVEKIKRYKRTQPERLHEKSTKQIKKSARVCYYGDFVQECYPRREPRGHL